MVPGCPDGWINFLGGPSVFSRQLQHSRSDSWPRVRVLWTSRVRTVLGSSDGWPSLFRGWADGHGPLAW